MEPRGGPPWSLLADVGGISGVRSTLSSVKVPPDVIEEIVAILEDDAGRPGPRRLPPVKGAWYGGSASAPVPRHAHREGPPRAAERPRRGGGRASRRPAGHAAVRQGDRRQADADSEAAAQALLHRTSSRSTRWTATATRRRPRPTDTPGVTTDGQPPLPRPPPAGARPPRDDESHRRRLAQLEHPRDPARPASPRASATRQEGRQRDRGPGRRRDGREVQRDQRQARPRRRRHAQGLGRPRGSPRPRPSRRSRPATASCCPAR